MNIIKTIDLWTERIENHQDVISGAFVDGLEEEGVPFDSYKVVKNCNCIITTDNHNLNISNKHNAIIFYKDNTPVRLVVMNKRTDVDNCIYEALNQPFNEHVLSDIYESYHIKRMDENLNQQSIINKCDYTKEIDVGSCDRPSLLDSMLEGSYTQSDTNYGKSNSDCNYIFVPNINIKYDLSIDNEHFIIQHHCAFINENMTRVIPLQDDSLLNIEEINSQFTNDNKTIKK